MAVESEFEKDKPAWNAIYQKERAVSKQLSPTWAKMDTKLTNGRNEGLIEGIVGKPEKDACLANSWVSDQKQLEEVIVGLFGHSLVVLLWSIWFQWLDMTSVDKPESDVFFEVPKDGSHSPVDDCASTFE